MDGTSIEPTLLIAWIITIMHYSLFIVALKTNKNHLRKENGNLPSPFVSRFVSLILYSLLGGPSFSRATIIR
ncbi:hypothetical protein KP509_14G086900 [Ceratopteris richardii]|uniref:Uncharacterized protein n=1 Tax=Ceratopteris richardii TaxID=49495 RepID=A0A8T2TF19_CERRI|nr:hypothetical protein KP509_14G086900 [Ceratopteris richardii]